MRAIAGIVLRQRWLLLAPWLFAAPAGLAQASEDDAARMVSVKDLREEARIARADNLVLVLEFSSEYCGYCRKLEDLFLLPMQRNPEYESKVLIRSVSLDEYEFLVDFDGNFTSTGEFAAKYRVSVTPTLVFLDSEGREISKKLVGIWSEDFYGGYIDNRIDEARANL
jgi:thioredoxin-related protein